MGKINKSGLSYISMLTVFLILLFTSGCITTPTGKQAPLPGDPVAYFPKMKVGDSWVTKGFSQRYKSDIYHARVAEVDADGGFVLKFRADKSGNYSLRYNNKYQETEVISSSGKITKQAKPLPLSLNFPLFVGKKWTDHYSGESIRGRLYDYRNEYRVYKYETVTTKAGSFKAFKIWRWQTLEGFGDQSWRTVTWYSPEMKRIIKTYAGKSHEAVELLSYKLAKSDKAHSGQASQIKPKKFVLSIVSFPSGARIYLDDKHRGYTPEKMKVSKGFHHIKFDKAGYQILEENFKIERDDSVSYILKKLESANTDMKQPSYQLSISSTPSGADIYLDKIYKGKTPIEIEVTRWNHGIKLEKEGYETLEENIWVIEDNDFLYSLVDTESPGIKISAPVNNSEIFNEKILLKGDITDNTKLKQIAVKLNNKNIYHQEIVEPSSAFILAKKVKLNSGRNNIIIEATDQAGNQTQKSITVYRTGPAEEKPAKEKEPSTIPKSGSYYAVIIGIGKYQAHKIPSLKYATVDAKLIYNILTDPQYGNFPKSQVKLLINEKATYNNIKSAIGTWLKKNSKKDDTVIIFFAGHGAPEEDKNYWVPYNANINDLYGTALSNNEIADMFKRVESKKVIAFLDSCYSEAKTGRERIIKIAEDPFRKFKGKGRVVVTSSDGKEKSLELKEFGHGLFAYYLAEALKGKADNNKDGFVELNETWDYIKHSVTDTARKHGSTQTPVLDGKYSTGIVLSKNPEKIKKIQRRKEVNKKELESRITKMKKLYLKGEITSSQLGKALRILKSGEENKILNAFLQDKITLPTFKETFK